MNNNNTVAAAKFRSKLESRIEIETKTDSYVCLYVHIYIGNATIEQQTTIIYSNRSRQSYLPEQIQQKRINQKNPTGTRQRHRLRDSFYAIIDFQQFLHLFIYFFFQNFFFSIFFSCIFSLASRGIKFSSKAIKM